MNRHKDLFSDMLDRLSGTYPNDERTSRINEKGFALCGLFYAAAPVLTGTVKIRGKNILTPPRVVHIRLNTSHMMLRLPVYALTVLPYIFFISFARTADAGCGDLSCGVPVH